MLVNKVNCKLEVSLTVGCIQILEQISNSFIPFPPVNLAPDASTTSQRKARQVHVRLLTEKLESKGSKTRLCFCLILFFVLGRLPSLEPHLCSSSCSHPDRWNGPGQLREQLPVGTARGIDSRLDTRQRLPLGASSI